METNKQKSKINYAQKLIFFLLFSRAAAGAGFRYRDTRARQLQCIFRISSVFSRVNFILGYEILFGRTGLSDDNNCIRRNKCKEFQLCYILAK